MMRIEDQVREWARGMYTLTAAAELLIRQGKAIYDGAPWLVRRSPDHVAIDTERLLQAAGAWSGGERRIVNIAASLLDDDHTVALGDVISGLDREHLSLVLAALAHAGGSHEHSGLNVDDNGRATITHLPSLYPWPNEEDDDA